MKTSNRGHSACYPLLAVLLTLVLPIAAMADQEIADDLIVQGNACVGFDCVDGESFGDDTLRIKENNLRIVFYDTSGAPPSPSNAWRITANSTSNGGASRFSIDDLDAAVIPFRGVEGTEIDTDTDDTTSIALGNATLGTPFDLVVGNLDQPNRIYPHNGTRSPFEGVTGSNISDDSDATRGIALVDVNGDSRGDVIAGNFGETNRLYLNDGVGDPFDTATGSDITSDAHDTTAIAVGNLDLVSRPDLVVANSGQPLRVYLNNNTADPFNGVAGSNITSDVYTTTSVSLRDVNDDLFPDVVAGNLGEANRLYLHGGGADPYGSTVGVDISSDAHLTTSVDVGDVNGDTFTDVVVGNRGQVNRLYLGNGTAAPFNGVTGLDITSDTDDTESIALVDLDGDGLLDVLVGNDSQADRAYLNNGDPVDPFGGVVGNDIEPTSRATRAITATIPPVAFDSLPIAQDYAVVGSLGEVNVALLNDDRDGGTSPFILEAGAPSTSLLVHEDGAVGIGTADPDLEAVLDVAGDLNVQGRLEITGHARSGVVRRKDFGGKKIASVTFATPYSQEFAVQLTAVTKSPGASFRPIVTRITQAGFEFARGGSLSNLVEFHWSTRLLGEY